MKQFIDRKSVLSLFISMIVALSSLAGSAFAQQTDEAAPQATDAGSQVKPLAPTEPGASAQAVAALEQRVKNLEQEIIDLRTMIGTYASMGRGAGGLRANPGRPSAPSSNLPWGAGDQPSVEPRQQGMIDAPSDGANFQGPQSVLSSPPAGPDVREEEAGGEAGAGRLASRQQEEAGLALPQGEPAGDPRQDRMKETSIGPAVASKDKDAQSLYNDAYSHMLRRDYASAQSAFGALIKNHPQSRMAGNAQYWLGETYYVRGKYRPAADAFLKAYRNYSNGIKAPDSLMKLAFSLARLGQKGAACKTFAELDLKFPNAPNHVKQRAGMESRRTGCN